MKIYSFKNSGEMLSYNVGINQIEIDPNEVQINDLVKLIEIIQSHHKDTIVQFFNDKYILNPEHILLACYFVQKAFYTKTNISNKKNLEFLLYLSAKRQIKLSLESFGVNNNNLQKRKISYCIITSKDPINQVSIEINKYLNSKEIHSDFEEMSEEKYKIIKDYFSFSDNQILIVLKSYGYNKVILDSNISNLEHLFRALNDLICEKMVLLSLEKKRSN
jgi:tRNA threonylcarbamoyladenosine modification (KEOPS) complex Cgi121 subunit